MKAGKENLSSGAVKLYKLSPFVRIKGVEISPDIYKAL